MVCKYCGDELQQNINFCPNCGTSVIDTTNLQPKRQQKMSRGKTIRVGIILAIAVIIAAAIFILTAVLGTPQNKIKGTWVRDNSALNTSDTVTYLFTNEGGTTTYSTDATGFASNAADFSWYITEDKDLIILWSNTSCTRYVWNSDYMSYALSPNEFNWCISGDTLYLSGSTELGYFTYTKER